MCEGRLTMYRKDEKSLLNACAALAALRMGNACVPGIALPSARV